MNYSIQTLLTISLRQIGKLHKIGLISKYYIPIIIRLTAQEHVQMSRVISIYLEGFDFSIARRMVKEGGLPELTDLANNSLQFEVDQGQTAVRTGLCGEQIATGKSPEQLDSYYLTRFDPSNYDFYITTSKYTPLSASVDETNVAFDLAYYQLDKSPNTNGITAWGSHDIGCKPFSRPASLRDELLEKFGPYKGMDYKYGFSWTSIEKTRDMGEKLKAAVEQRANVAEWLLSERLTDWKMANIAVSEPHSAVEGFFHGLDPSHPVGHHPSAKAAKEAMYGIYQACDALVGQLRRRFEDARLVVYSMHGMAANDSDVPAMALLPEILYRREFNKPFLNTDACSTTDPETGILIPVHPTRWEKSIREGIIDKSKYKELQLRWLRRQGRKRREMHNEEVYQNRSTEGLSDSVDWMPGTLYRPYWPKMRAFCLPCFTDGTIRLNVKSREKHGIVTPEEYVEEVNKIRDFVLEIIDPATNLPVAKEVEINETGDPFKVGAKQADLIVIWQQAQHTTTFKHPTIGTVGPLPTRRTGGHTGGHGMAFVDLRDSGLHALLKADEIEAEEKGISLDSKRSIPLRKSFDVIPTVYELAGYEAKDVAGVNLLDLEKIKQPTEA